MLGLAPWDQEELLRNYQLGGPQVSVSENGISCVKVSGNDSASASDAEQETANAADVEQGTAPAIDADPTDPNVEVHRSQTDGGRSLLGWNDERF